MKRKSIALILTLAILSSACSASLTKRLVNAVGAIPSVVRVLVPNSNPQVISDLELAFQTFKEFRSDPTVSRWEKAERVWNVAKQRLVQLNHPRLNMIITATEILLGQITLPVGVAGSGGGADTTSDRVVVKLKEPDVRELERLVALK